MKKHWVNSAILVVLVLAALVPAILAPSQAEAIDRQGSWMVYTPNHPNACAPLPWDCFVIYIIPEPE